MTTLIQREGEYGVEGRHLELTIGRLANPARQGHSPGAPGYVHHVRHYEQVIVRRKHRLAAKRKVRVLR